MGDVNDPGFGWDEPIDRRTLLGRAALAGGALAAGGLLAGGATAAPTAATVEDLIFLSAQFTPIQEAEAVRKYMLSGFDSKVDFVAPSSVGGETEVVNRIVAESKAGQGKVDLLGGLHGLFVSMQAQGLLTNLADVAKDFTSGKNAIPKNLMDLGKLGTNQQLFIPWGQATYVIVANKKVLPYLPKGVNPNKITYGQFAQWAKTIAEKEGRPRLGMPASPTGLIHRFFQGYLIPSFTGRYVTKYESTEAIAAWNYLRSLWRFVHPQSLSYGFMQDPLLSGEVLLAWEHVARLKNALEARPNDFGVYPAPRGPKGRGYMPVLAGLAIPKSSPHKADAKLLIRHLLSLPVQARMLSSTGFFPVVAGRLSKQISAGLRLESNAVKIQQLASDSFPALLPVGIGAESGNFNTIYRDTFTAIVLNGQNPANVVKEQGAKLQAIFDKTGAPCWAPDPKSTGACRVA
jgi:multiple sugar transport system substrate-binding protein